MRNPLRGSLNPAGRQVEQEDKDRRAAGRRFDNRARRPRRFGRGGNRRRDAIAASFEVTAVLANAGCRDVAALPAALHEAPSAYTLGIAPTTSVLRGTPQLTPPTRPPQAHAQRRHTPAPT